jgi:hypothetical protein
MPLIDDTLIPAKVLSRKSIDELNALCPSSDNLRQMAV